MSGCYEPPAPKSPWYSSHFGGPGGLTPLGWTIAVILALPVVLGGVGLVWIFFGP